MPLVWSTDPENRTMTAVAEGEITRADLEAFFAETTAANVAPYYKLFDASASTTTMGAEDMLALGVLIRSLQQPGMEMGPLALVLPVQMMELAHRMVGILAIADRPMQVFTDVDAARAWLDEKRGVKRPPKKRGPGKRPKA